LTNGLEKLQKEQSSGYLIALPALTIEIQRWYGSLTQ